MKGKGSHFVEYQALFHGLFCTFLLKSALYYLFFLLYYAILLQRLESMGNFAKRKSAT